MQGAAAVYVTLIRVPRALQMGKGAKSAQATCQQQVLQYQCVIIWQSLTSDS